MGEAIKPAKIKLAEIYCRDSEKTSPENKDKKIISDDAFAICEYLERLIKKIGNKI